MSRDKVELLNRLNFLEEENKRLKVRLEENDEALDNELAENEKLRDRQALFEAYALQYWVTYEMLEKCLQELENFNNDN